MLPEPVVGVGVVTALVPPTITPIEPEAIRVVSPLCVAETTIVAGMLAVPAAEATSVIFSVAPV